MIRTLWIDASHGIAGDMLLGALLDAGASLGVTRSHIAALGVEPISLDLRSVRRHGMRAARAEVTTSDDVSERHLSDVTAILCGAAIPDAVRDAAIRVFERLADAEARAHGVDRDAIHFHEVGALDALADVVGCCSALHQLGLLAQAGRIVAGPVAVGAGSTRSAHGTIPVPVPAVLTLLESSGATVRAGGARLELCTPTGAALLVSLVDEWADLPAMTIDAVGLGAGTADPPAHLNVTRAVLGSAANDALGVRQDDLVMVHATIDDLDPRLWPALLDELHRAGAFDAWATPAIMRKGRPGHVVYALGPPETADAIFAALVANSSTLGARSHAVSRWALARDQRTVHVDSEPITVKRGLWQNRAIIVQPEYDEVRAAAQKLGLPVRDVLERAKAAAQDVRDG